MAMARWKLGLVRVQFVLGEGWSAALRVFRPGTPTWTLVSETAIDTTQLIPNTGCGLVDLEDDGTPDVVVGDVSGLRTLRNKGDASFVDVTETAVPELMGRDVWSIAGADLEHDGHGDIVLGNGLTDFLCLHPPPPPAKVWSDLEVLRDVLWRKEGAASVDASSALTVVDDGELSQIVPYDVDADGRDDLVMTLDPADAPASGLWQIYPPPP